MTVGWSGILAPAAALVNARAPRAALRRLHRTPFGSVRAYSARGASAGVESTASLTGNAVRILAEQPLLQQELRENPLLVPDFIEEALRLESSFRGHYRHVRRDTKLGNVKLARDSHLLLLWAAANRDPETFPKPDAVDFHRAAPREHLAFGRGTHFCLGARLARLETRIVLEELLERTRSFSLDPRLPPTYVSSIFVRRHEVLGLCIEA